MTAATALFVGGAVVFAVVVVRAGEQRQMQSALTTLELSFPRALSAEASAQLVSSLTGLLPPWWKRWLATPVVALEVVATEAGIEHFLTFPTCYEQAVASMLQASLPNVRYRSVSSPAIVPTAATEYRMTSGSRQLRTHVPAQAATLLASLQPLHHGEQIVVQLLLTPSGPVQPARLAPRSNTRWVASDLPATGEAVTALRRKQAQPMLLGVARIGTAAGSVKRARQLIRRAEVSWHGTRAPGVHLQRRMLHERVAGRRLRSRQSPLTAWPLSLNAEEVTAHEAPPRRRRPTGAAGGVSARARIAASTSARSTDHRSHSLRSR